MKEEKKNYVLLHSLIFLGLSVGLQKSILTYLGKTKRGIFKLANEQNCCQK